MKQKCQAKQNTKKKLKETLNWTSSGETVSPDVPVTLHRSNRLAADAPVPYHQCNGPCNAQAMWRKASITGCTGDVKWEPRCNHHAITQRACQVGVTQHRLNRWCTRQGTSVILRQKLKISSGPDEPLKHRCMGPV